MPSKTNAPPPPRKSRTFRGWMLRLMGGVIVASLAAWLLYSGLDWSRWKDRARLASHKPVSGMDSQHAQGAAGDTRAKRAPPLEARDALTAIEPSVGLIESDGPAGLTPIGSAFVVDAAGLVATNYHVAAEMTQGLVRFRNGSLFEIEGYRALDRQNDLAILQLRKASGLQPVRLKTDDPAPLTKIFALGHPHGVEFSLFDGTLSQVLTTSQLPAATGRFVRELTGSPRDQLWIQHTAKLSDGNSGGPLVNAAGEVLGINTWTDRQSGFGYALHAREIAALLKQPLDEVEPLERHATSEARLRSLVWQTSAAQLRQLAEEAQAMNWQPANRRDYAKLQQLAWGITLANRPQLSGSQAALGTRLDDLVKAADQIVAHLRTEKWTEVGQFILLNEFAAQEVSRPLAGLLFIGTLERVVEGPTGQRGAIVTLAGFEQRLIVPLEGGLILPEPGSQCLFVGVNDRGRTVQYGDNPLQPIVAPVVIAPVVIVLGR